MPHPPSRGERVSIIGAGRVGTAMAGLLPPRGYPVVAVADVDRYARERAASLAGALPCERNDRAASMAEIIIITTPDGRIAETCASIAASGVELVDKKVMHMSGALSLEVLKPAADVGAGVLAIHPIQTFADLEGASMSLPGSTFGVTCGPGLEEWAEEFVSSLDGRAIAVRDSDRVVYHAAAAVACNLLAMVHYGTYVACRRLGFSDEETSRAFTPLAEATVRNVGRLGPAAALTGPLSRGDVETVRAHVEAFDGFDPDLAELYRAVSRWGLRLVAEKGLLDGDTLEWLERALD